MSLSDSADDHDNDVEDGSSVSDRTDMDEDDEDVGRNEILDDVNDDEEAEEEENDGRENDDDEHDSEIGDTTNGNRNDEDHGNSEGEDEQDAMSTSKRQLNEADDGGSTKSAPSDTAISTDKASETVLEPPTSSKADSQSSKASAPKDSTSKSRGKQSGKEESGEKKKPAAGQVGVKRPRTKQQHIVTNRKGRTPSIAGLTIPFRTVKKAMKLDPDIPIVQNEAAILTTLAAELYVMVKIVNVLWNLILTDTLTTSCSILLSRILCILSLWNTAF